MAVVLLSLLVFSGVLLLCVLLLVKLRPGSARFDSGGSPLVPPPHLPSLPVLGSLLSLRGDRPPHLLFQALQERYGSLYSLMLGPHRLLLVNHHLHAREVLLKKGKLFAGRPRSVTTDVLTRGGKDIAFGDFSATWRFHRKAASRGAPLDLAPELTRAVTNVVCALCFSSSYRRGDPEFRSMLRYSQGIVDTIFPNADLRLLKDCADYSDHVQRDLLDALLRAKRSAENHNTPAETGEGEGPGAGPAAAGVGLSDDHLLMTVGDIFGAGVETTTTVLKWAVAYLIHYPQVQKRIQEELDVKVGRDRNPQLRDRGTLPYLEASIREVLRIRPVAPLLIPHVALADTSIGNFSVKKGDRVIINLWSLHHDEKEWKNPEIFDPARFLDEEGSGLVLPSASYLPFGAGVRVCLGESLAKMELFLFLSWTLQRFTFSVPPGQPLPSLEGKFGVVLQPAKYEVRATPRAGWES
ncbi:hypothetical protein CRUP_005655 [Coryphaenoides rupestris]|nr:hypothetical protein CRUP_005655 [Coryphaenoides rupestris]